MPAFDQSSRVCPRAAGSRMPPRLSGGVQGVPGKQRGHGVHATGREGAGAGAARSRPPARRSDRNRTVSGDCPVDCLARRGRTRHPLVGRMGQAQPASPAEDVLRIIAARRSGGARPAHRERAPASNGRASLLPFAGAARGGPPGRPTYGMRLSIAVQTPTCKDSSLRRASKSSRMVTVGAHMASCA